MISLETETDRTLFFDLLPLDVGVVGGMKVRLQLYTVPGQVFYNATRKLVLKGVDGIVFVADSQLAMLDANAESLRNLETNLAELKLDLRQLPVVFQYNKRDLRGIHTVDRLNASLNPTGAPSFEAAARHGLGVFETLKCISGLALSSLRRKLAEDVEKRGAPSVGEPPEAVVAYPRAERAAAVAEPEQELPLEFAEEATDKHMRAVPTRDRLDIQKELEKLRALTASGAARVAVASSSKDVERRLKDMLVTSSSARQEVRRKASVEVPAHLLKGASSLRIQIGFDGTGAPEAVADTLTVNLVGNRKLERLTLLLELELKAKS
jgi:hypothetical protein